MPSPGGITTRHRLRRRAPRAGAHRRRRHDLGLGRLRRQGLHQPGDRDTCSALKRGTLEGPAARWLDVLHPLDRDRFRASLDSVLEQRRGRLTQDFRLRSADGHYLWFTLKARPVVGSDGEVVRARRHADRRHRVQERRRTSAARRRARQPDRPAQPRTVHRPLGKRPGVRQGRPGDQAHRHRHRPRPLQAGQRFGRHRGRRFHPADAGAPARRGCSSRRTRWRGFRATSSR